MRYLRLGLLFVGALVASTVTADAQVIAGRITDASSGQAIAAAQVFVSALDLGALSEGNGTYTIQNVPAGTHTVSVQRLGFAPEEQSVTLGPGQTVQLNFQLESQALSLDEIVVTGTAGGSQRRAIGNVVAQVSMDDLTSVNPVSNVEHALSGRVPGVMLLPSTSAGGGARIRIRGNSSIGVAGDPIIFVDGVRLNENRANRARYYALSRLADFDPADIESIEIIKGPAAATLYGTEASDGVIQIVTKRGQVGAPVFEFSTELGENWFPQWKSYRRDAWAPVPALCPALPCADESQLKRINYPREDIARGLPATYQSGLIQRYNFSVRGGTDLIRYSFGINRSDQEGVVYWNEDERNALRTSIGITANDNLNILFNGSYFQGEYRPPEGFWGAEFGFGGRPTTFFDGTTGLQDFDDDSNRGWRDGGPARYCHVEANTPWCDDVPNTRYDHRITSKRSTWSIQADLENLGWLTHRLTFGVDQVYEKELEFRPKDAVDGNFWWSEGQLGEREISVLDAPVYTVDFSGTATFRLMDGVLGTATSYGAQYYNKQEVFTETNGENFAVPALATVGGASVTNADETFVENTTFGMYFQEQLDWDNRIFLTGAVRLDDNSAFGADFNRAVYPKISGAWVLSEEDFWNIDFVDQFRLRGAWGEAGKQPDAFASTRLYTPETGPGGEPILTPDQFGNPALGPETGSEFEVGFEAVLADSRFTVDFTYYDRKTLDAIVGQTLSPSLWPGAAGDFAGGIQLVNIGEVHNWGSETSVNAQIIREGPLQLDMDVAFTTQQNRINDMGGLTRIQVGRARAHYEGFSIAAQSDKRVIHAEFVNGVNGPVQNVLCDPGSGKRGLEFTDVDGMSTAELIALGLPCDDAPLLVWGDSNPTKLLNVNTTLTIFDNLRLSANIDGQFGHVISHDYQGARFTSHPSARLVWLQDLAIPQAYRDVTRNGLSYADAGFLKLREVALAYRLPENLASRVGATSANVRLGLRNWKRLWLEQRRVYRERPVDPEVTRDTHDFGGESGGGWPVSSQWTARVTLTF